MAGHIVPEENSWTKENFLIFLKGLHESEFNLKKIYAIRSKKFGSGIYLSAVDSSGKINHIPIKLIGGNAKELDKYAARFNRWFVYFRKNNY